MSEAETKAYEDKLVNLVIQRIKEAEKIEKKTETAEEVFNPFNSFKTFSSDGKYVVIYYDGKVIILNQKDGTILHTMQHPNVNSAIFSPDSNYVMSSSNTCIYIWP